MNECLTGVPASQADSTRDLYYGPPPPRSVSAHAGRSVRSTAVPSIGSVDTGWSYPRDDGRRKEPRPDPPSRNPEYSLTVRHTVAVPCVYQKGRRLLSR